MTSSARVAGPPGGSPGLYDAIMWPAEQTFLRARRRRLTRRARGRVLEIGGGTGVQLRWYRPDAEVVVLEPDAAMAARARERARAAIARVTVVEGVAEELPFPDESFDTVAASFVFCTVTDPEGAFAEALRVLRPGGLLLLLEHVHVRWQPARALLSGMAPYWARMAGGCRLDRDTVGSLKAAGFELLHRRDHELGWMVEVVARRPMDRDRSGDGR